MTAAEELQIQRQSICAKIDQYQAKLAEGGSETERARCREKVSIYRQALMDIDTQMEHFGLQVPKKKARRRAKNTSVGEENYHYFSLLHGAAALDGRVFFEACGENKAKIQGGLELGSVLLSDCQREYLDAYFNRGMPIAQIADQYSVNKSTIYRTMLRGLKRMWLIIEISRCVQQSLQDGEINWDLYYGKMSKLVGHLAAVDFRK